MIGWLPCSKRAKHYVSRNCSPKSLKSKQKPYYSSMEHSVKAYADDVTLISDSLKVHVSALQQIIDQKAADLDLSFKPSKCVSYLLDGHSHRKEGIQLSGGCTKSLTEGSTTFLVKSLEVGCH